MFLTLGLLVFPSQLPGVAVGAILLALFLMLVARPVAVFLSLPGRRFALNEKSLFPGWACGGPFPSCWLPFLYWLGLSRRKKSST